MSLYPADPFLVGAGMRTHSLALFFFTLLVLSPQQTNQFSLSSYKTLISLTDALLNRVASDRESRGDFDGAERARELAEKFRKLTGGTGIFTVGWDFAWNYVIRGEKSMAEIKRNGVRLFEVLKGISDLESGLDRTRWVIKNFEFVVELTNSWFNSVLAVFNRKGALHETILMFQRELMEGGLLKDIMEVGAQDLDALLHCMKNVFFPDVNYDYDEL